MLVYTFVQAGEVVIPGEAGYSPLVMMKSNGTCRAAAFATTLV